MWTCNYCNTENEDDDFFCIECGAAKPQPSTNHCSNPNCTFYNVILPNPRQKFCGKCGAATTYQKEIESFL